MLIRSNYIEKLKKLENKQIIKVLTGVRRCGKSTILKQFSEELKLRGVRSEQIIFYNFEDLALSDLQDYRKLYQTINEALLPNEMNYIFLDEIQNVSQFEKVLDSLFIKENVDLYVTGSNAYMLSGELATLLSGRYIELHIFPLSFSEYVSQFDEDVYRLFDQYMENGGFPFTLQLNDRESSEDYLSGVVNTVLVKDVLSRKQRSDSMLVEQLARFLVDTSGSLVTVKKIADSLTSMGQKTTSDTVLTYLSAFQEAFLFYRCDRYDISGKKYLSINSKYYPVDLSLRQALVGNKRPNLGHRLEGAVYLELLRRGYKVYVGNIGQNEVDFVAQKNGITEYYQVSLTVKDEHTYQREVSSFVGIRDNFRKILLTEDFGSYNDNGIEQINVVDWLLDK